MKRLFPFFALILLLGTAAKPTDKDAAAFRRPANEYRPMPFWHLNGTLTRDTIVKQINRAKREAGFGGIAVLPVSGTRPEYLTDAYFERYDDMIETMHRNGMELIIYDDIDFPSGTAGGRLQAQYPRDTRKLLEKDEYVITGPATFTQILPDSTEKLLMATTAMNINTYEMIDLRDHIRDGKVTWEVPPGAWRVMFFCCRYNVRPQVDYMDTTAVRKFIRMNYDEYGKRYGKYMGNTVKRVFYDDIGFNGMEKTWTPAITEIFEKSYGKNAALYYPALFYDIGPETEAARVAFHTIRSELMAEGYPRLVADWCADHNVSSIGHPPGNYTKNTTELHGDILKFYRHSQIPLADYIFYYGYGRDGHKQISSAADLYDRPMVGAEVNGAFKADMDSLMLYRVAMDMFSRGINFLIPHGMWYDNRPEKVYIPPVISSYNPALAATLPQYSDFVARSCYMLQGGRRVSKIALLYPITSLQGHHKFDIAVYRPWGEYVPAEADFQAVGSLLTNRLHRDFTFIHPESLVDGRITGNDGNLVLHNRVNHQEYDLLIIPGGKVLSAETLKKIKAYYDGGGKILATTALPTKSAEFGRDAEINNLIAEIFGPKKQQDDGQLRTNARGGMALFVSDPDAGTLANTLDRLGIAPDVNIVDTTSHHSGNGVFNYIHKQRDGKDIYFFSNSTDDNLTTPVELEGCLTLEAWNPYTGKVAAVPAETVSRDGKDYTRFDLTLPAVKSTFIVGRKQQPK